MTRQRPRNRPSRIPPLNSKPGLEPGPLAAHRAHLTMMGENLHTQDVVLTSAA